MKTYSNNEPLISIITVCYNSECTIKKTIESVLSQTFSNYEYLIVDGKSNDKTVEIINSYIDKFNGKMSYISETDNGIYDAMNKGINLCKGKLIGILNSDDWYEEDCLEKVVERYESNASNGMDVIYGALRLIKNEKEYEIVFKNHEFIKERMINHPSCFISRAIYEEFGGYNTKYKISADYEFFLRINKVDSIQYKKTYSILANFRLGGESSTLNGVLETARLKKEYGLISSKKYSYIVLKTNIIKLIKKIKSIRKKK
ncbi:glycosyltransferase family 2 protein [Bacillus sp. E214]|uniref:glycosyltransferase family 2 protein n=1 Tax=Bacillus sp. E214 TaxID=2587156 RepID=UPI0011E007D9|nr:glycosyltransferase family 2 protein [Bacillus sp. E214]